MGRHIHLGPVTASELIKHDDENGPNIYHFISLYKSIVEVSKYLLICVKYV